MTLKKIVYQHRDRVWIDYQALFDMLKESHLTSLSKEDEAALNRHRQAQDYLNPTMLV